MRHAHVPLSRIQIIFFQVENYALKQFTVHSYVRSPYIHKLANIGRYMIVTTAHSNELNVQTPYPTRDIAFKNDYSITAYTNFTETGDRFEYSALEL